jgi:hypothetical protein
MRWWCLSLNFWPDAAIPLASYNVSMATNPKRPRDINQLAKLIAGISTGETEEQKPDAGKDAAAVARGRQGGLKGGVERMKNLSDEERKSLALKAANARWHKKG